MSRFGDKEVCKTGITLNCFMGGIRINELMFTKCFEDEKC